MSLSKAVNGDDGHPFPSPEGCQKLAGGNTPGTRINKSPHPGRGAGNCRVLAPLPGCIPMETSVPGVVPPANFFHASGVPGISHASTANDFGVTARESKHPEIS